MALPVAPDVLIIFVLLILLVVFLLLGIAFLYYLIQVMKAYIESSGEEPGADRPGEDVADVEDG